MPSTNKTSKMPKQRFTFKTTGLFISLLLAGALLPLAFAPINIWSFAILSPAFLLWIWQHPILTPTPRKAFWHGFAFGIGMFGVGVSWVFVSIHRYGNTDAPLALVLTLLFIAVLALFIGAIGFILKRTFRGAYPSLWLLGFPCLWVLFEWLRSSVLSGFPWILLGNSQLSSPLAGFAPIGSVYLVSLAVILTSGCVIAIIQGTPKIKLLASILILFVWGLGETLHLKTWTTPVDKEYTVSLVQGNISPIDKFVQNNPIEVARNVYGGLTEEHWKSDFIVWPENAIAYPLPHAEPFLKELKDKVQIYGSTLITGVQTRVNQNDFYNTMAIVGKELQLYHKRHLVPFGEFLPFDSLLRGLINFLDIPMSNFIEGPEKQALIKRANLTLAPMICYEIAYPSFVRESLRQDTKTPGAIVTISEDGWFGDSWGPHQHLQIAQMRALETGRYIIRATTCGISAVINPEGTILAASSQFKPLTLTSTFKASTGITPWIRIGIWPVLTLLLAGWLVYLLCQRKANAGKG